MIQYLLLIFSIIFTSIFPNVCRCEDALNTKTGELATLNLLISATERSLQTQKQLRERIEIFLTLQKQYIENPDDTDLLIRVVKEAKYVLDTIEESHLTHNFDPEFIKELTIFAKVANKRDIPRS